MPKSVLRLYIPSLPPAEYSANTSRGQHWSKKHSVTQAAYDEIIAEVRNQDWHHNPLHKAHISVTFFLPDRRKRDAGMLQERMKPYFDGLIHAGVLTDDSLDVIGWPEYHHEYRPRYPGTTIVIKEVSQ